MCQEASLTRPITVAVCFALFSCGQMALAAPLLNELCGALILCALLQGGIIIISYIKLLYYFCCL